MRWTITWGAIGAVLALGILAGPSGPTPQSALLLMAAAIVAGGVWLGHRLDRGKVKQ